MKLQVTLVTLLHMKYSSSALPNDHPMTVVNHMVQNLNTVFISAHRMKDALVNHIHLS